MDEAQGPRQQTDGAIGWAMTSEDAPASWNVGTYWRLLSTASTTNGRSTTFEELCSPGVVAPPHVHDHEEEAFFVLEGDLVFLLDEQEIEAPPGTYVYIAPGTRHGFRCNSEVGRVFNTLVPGGFDHGVSENGEPAPRVAIPPPGVSALDVWRELDQHRPRPPWDGSDDPQWAVTVATAELVATAVASGCETECQPVRQRRSDSGRVRSRSRAAFAVGGGPGGGAIAAPARA